MLYNDPYVALGFLVVGFLLLIKGADWLVRGAVAIAWRIGISELLIGITVVAFGTSLPELVINLLANNSETAPLAVGNIIGANIANIWLILGICAMLTPLAVHRQTVWREILFAVGASLVLLTLASDQFIDLSSFSGLARADGLILLILFALFVYYIVGKIHLHPKAKTAMSFEETAGKYSRAKSMALVLIGILCLAFGGNFIVGSGSSLAETLGVGTEVVGLTVIALGTTAPELVTALTAVRKNKTDLAVGSLVGSTLFNTLWILGISSVWRPLPFDSIELIDTGVAAGALIMLFVVLLVNRKRQKNGKPSYYHVLGASSGLLFLACYIGYLIYLILRTQAGVG